MRSSLLRGVAFIAAASLIVPPPVAAQVPPPGAAAQPPAAAPATVYNAEQLDALLAQIALYPDALLTQMLMASTYPLQIVEAWRWLQQDNNKALTGDALVQALQAQSWDPSVKSLVPFPQVLNLLNSNLEWTQQLGYAFANQQTDVWNSIQRLRAQAWAAGKLRTTEQQTVTQENGAIVIQPANPEVVYVPVYNPAIVYGEWPYPLYPPVWYPPPPDYVLASELLTGIVFVVGVIVVGPLWGWCGPRWYGGHGAWGGSLNVNVNRYNSINIHRPPLPPGGWHPPPPGGPGGRPNRPPGGPVGQAGRPVPLPANAIGRPNVQVPANLVNPRPQPSGAGGGLYRAPYPTQRPAGAFNDVPYGGRVNQFGQRGAESRSFQQPRPSFGGGGAVHVAPSPGGGGVRGGGINRRP